MSQKADEIRRDLRRARHRAEHHSGKRRRRKHNPVEYSKAMSDVIFLANRLYEVTGRRPQVTDYITGETILSRISKAKSSDVSLRLTDCALYHKCLTAAALIDSGLDCSGCGKYSQFGEFEWMKSPE